jgi:hypothetical protein
MNARNDAGSIKFNGKLELTGTATETAELHKEQQFITKLKDKVKMHGVRTFFYMPNAREKMTPLLDEYHAFTVEEVIVEHDLQQLPERQESEHDTAVDETPASLALLIWIWQSLQCSQPQPTQSGTSWQPKLHGSDLLRSTQM